jgi:hypothetical protein
MQSNKTVKNHISFVDEHVENYDMEVGFPFFLHTNNIYFH